MNRIIALITVVTLVACVDYKEVNLISVDNVNLTKISGNGIEATVALTIDNPNDYKIKVDTKDLIFFLNGKAIGNTTLAKELTLEKGIKKSYDADLIVNLPPNGNIDLGMLMLMSGGNISMSLKGNIVGKAKGVSKTIEVDVTENISL